jgi:hypothetical protein
MNDSISPYLVALALVVLGALYGYYIGARDWYNRGREDGWNEAFDRERKL